MKGGDMSFCNTCVSQNNGRLLSEAEARIHKDNFPDHDVVELDCERKEAAS